MKAFLVYLMHIRSAQSRDVCIVHADTVAAAKEKIGCGTGESREIAFVPGIPQTFPPRTEVLFIGEIANDASLFALFEIPEAEDEKSFREIIGKMNPLA